MNAISGRSYVLNSAKTALAAACGSNRLVTRTYKEFDQYPKDVIKKGVFTILNPAEDNDEPMTYLDLVVLGQGFIEPATLKDEDANGPAGEQIDEYEGVMADNIRTFVQNITGCHAAIGGVRYSQQLESPYCWVAIDMRLGPLGMVPDVPTDGDTDIQPFITYTGDILVGSATEEEPSASVNLTLPQEP